MKKQFILFDNERWHPSTFYDQKTELCWIMDYSLFVKIYTGKVNEKEGTKYAIHKDVYNAFLFQFMSNGRKKKRETRKSRFVKSLNKTRKNK